MQITKCSKGMLYSKSYDYMEGTWGWALKGQCMVPRTRLMPTIVAKVSLITSE